MSKKNSSIKITEENYEIYAKLYNEKQAIYERIENNILLGSIGEVMLLAGGFITSTLLDDRNLFAIPGFVVGGTLLLNVSFVKEIANAWTKNQRLQIQKEYPHINTKVSYFELRDILKKEHMIVDDYAIAENYKMNQIAERTKKELFQISIENIKNTNFSSRDYKQDCKPLDLPKCLIKR